MPRGTGRGKCEGVTPPAAGPRIPALPTTSQDQRGCGSASDSRSMM